MLLQVGDVAAVLYTYVDSVENRPSHKRVATGGRQPNPTLRVMGHNMRSNGGKFPLEERGAPWLLERTRSYPSCAISCWLLQPLVDEKADDQRPAMPLFGCQKRPEGNFNDCRSKSSCANAYGWLPSWLNMRSTGPLFEPDMVGNILSLHAVSTVGFGIHRPPNKMRTKKLIFRKAVLYPNLT